MRNDFVELSVEQLEQTQGGVGEGGLPMGGGMGGLPFGQIFGSLLNQGGTKPEATGNRPTSSGRTAENGPPGNTGPSASDAPRGNQDAQKWIGVAMNALKTFMPLMGA